MAKAKLLEIHQDAFGLRFNFDTKTDLSDTLSLLLVLKVNATRVEIPLTPANISNTATGAVFYIVAAGDLATLGTYTGQIIDNSTGRYLPSDIFQFKVVPNV